MRYFFHLKHMTELVTDVEGVDFNTVEAARQEAILSIKENAAESLIDKRDFSLQSIRICDGNGNILDEIFAQDVLADVFAPAIALA